MILTIWDLLLPPFYIALILIFAQIVKKKNEKINPVYKYYVAGLLAKIAGAVFLCLIYQFYYRNGDTTNYFHSAQCIINLFNKDMSVFFDVMFGANTSENFSYFDISTGYPEYWGDSYAFFMTRLIVPICFLGVNSFIASSILVAWLCYMGTWKLYLLFSEQFPSLHKNLAISVLFIPSVVFWGSGILKDSVTLSAVGWYTYCFHQFFIKKKYNLFNSFAIIISSYLLISIKPYILFALLPGSLIWLSNEKTGRVKNVLLRVLIAPFLLFLGIGASYLALTQLGDSLGQYKIDNVLKRAVETQSDLKQDYYGGNAFDLGDLDGTISGMLSKSHLAIAAALFRPYLWDVKNPVMLLSAFENTYILILTIFLLIKLKIIGFFSLVGKHPLLLFSILFSLFFAFSVGISTPNFGALVRLKIPCIPFYVSSLFVLKYLYEQKSKPKLH